MVMEMNKLSISSPLEFNEECNGAVEPKNWRPSQGWHKGAIAVRRVAGWTLHTKWNGASETDFPKSSSGTCGLACTTLR